MTNARDRARGDGKRSRGAGVGNADSAPAIVVNGWTLLGGPLFLDQIDRLNKAAKAEEPNYTGTAQGANTKLLAHLLRLAFYAIPENPESPAFRQGLTMARPYTHWYRAKTGNGRYRLFFRFSTRERIIVFAWVNDSKTLRTYGGHDEAYAVFARMLEVGNPPDDWDALVRGASTDHARKKLAARCGDPAAYRGSDGSRE